MEDETKVATRPPILGMLVDHSRFLHRKTSPSKQQFASLTSPSRSSHRTSTPRPTSTTKTTTNNNNTKSTYNSTNTSITSTKTNQTTKNTTTNRSRLFTSFLNLTNQTPYTYIPQGDYSLQLHTEYDASSYALKPKEHHVAGPLVVAFLFYAKVLDPKVATGKYYPTFEDIDRAAKTMTFTELLAFCWDFNIVPQLISRGDLRYIFGCVHRRKAEKLTELTFYQFEELLTRVALVAFYPLTNGDIKRIGTSTMRKLREHVDSKRIRLKDVFIRFDTSGDGILSRDEFMAGLRDICGSAIKQRDLEAVYSLVDEDGGGEVEFIEFISAMNKAAPQTFGPNAAHNSNKQEKLFKVPNTKLMSEYDLSDSDNEDDITKSNRNNNEEEDDEDDDGTNKKLQKSSNHVDGKKIHKKSLHDYLNPTINEEETGTHLFPGGRDLTPKSRINALMRSMGRLTVANIRKIIDTRGRITAGKMNGSIKSQEKEYLTEELDNEAHTARILRKRDGTMCDYSAPLLMKRRASCTTDYNPDLTEMWTKLRRINRVDDWRSFHSPCGIYMGQILVNKKHQYRIVVRNPLPFSITIEVSIDRFPNTNIKFNRRPVASGMTTDIYIETNFKRSIEVLGTITIAWREWKKEIIARSSLDQKMKRRGGNRNGGNRNGGNRDGNGNRNNARVVECEDLDAGRCVVYLYAISYDLKTYGSRKAESKCPALQFKEACNGDPCPRNYLAPEHPAHKFSIPGQDLLVASKPTRRQLKNTLPNYGTARMQLHHLPQGSSNHVNDLDSGESSVLNESSSGERLKRGYLPHQWQARKDRESRK